MLFFNNFFLDKLLLFWSLLKGVSFCLSVLMIYLEGSLGFMGEGLVFCMVFKNVKFLFSFINDLMFFFVVLGMYEFLVFFFYVFYVDVECFFEVCKYYEDYFIDKFDGLFFEESDVIYNFDFKKFFEGFVDDEEVGGIYGSFKKMVSLDELDFEIKFIVMLSDVYGVEGELGIVLLDKFMEYDVYCMFDVFMSGFNGCVLMVGFFVYFLVNGLYIGLFLVFEVCIVFYNFLLFVDLFLYSYLVELGVEF